MCCEHREELCGRSKRVACLGKKRWQIEEDVFPLCL